MAAADTDPLFPTLAGDFPSKAAVTASMRVLLKEERPGQVDGHSLRWTGAHMLTAAGVEPWLVEWFGRWGSAAVRASVEDARSKAPETSTLALRVADLNEIKTTLTIPD